MPFNRTREPRQEESWDDRLLSLCKGLTSDRKTKQRGGDTYVVFVEVPEENREGTRTMKACREVESRMRGLGERRTMTRGRRTCGATWAIDGKN